jgi:hypothetical protein
MFFIPSVLRFSGSYETLYFKFIPKQICTTRITFSVGGDAAGLFTVPDPSSRIRITHDFHIPFLPSVVIGRTSPQLVASVMSELTSSVVLQPVAPNVVFHPPYLLFTPNMTSKTFTYTAIRTNNNLASGYNPVVTSQESNRYSVEPEVSDVTWKVREIGQSEWYDLTQAHNHSSTGVTVMPGAFKVHFSQLSIGAESTCTISVNTPPRSDVSLTLIGNNLNFDPPFVTFHPDVLSQTIKVTIVHSDFKDSIAIPYVVDYIISGTNYEDFVPPAQTYLGVARGNGPVVGSIFSGALSNIVSYTSLLFVVLAHVMLFLLM